MTFINLLKSLPAILSFLLELKKMWDDYIPEMERRKRLNEFTSKIKKSRETKNTEELETFVRDVVNNNS